MTFDFGQLVMDNEIAGMIRQVVKGIRVTDETLAVDATRSVGQFNDFLTHPSTFKYMKEQSQPEIIDRRGREKWEQSGSKDLYEVATAKAREILKHHVPVPLPDDVREKLRAIVANAQKERCV